MNPDDWYQEWHLEAICRTVDPELWFPEKGNASQGARHICFSCPVQEKCLEYALTNHERHGIWGGFNERERRALRRSAA